MQRFELPSYLPTAWNVAGAELRFVAIRDATKSQIETAIVWESDPDRLLTWRRLLRLLAQNNAREDDRLGVVLRLPDAKRSALISAAGPVQHVGVSDKQFAQKFRYRRIAGP